MVHFPFYMDSMSVDMSFNCFAKCCRPENAIFVSQTGLGQGIFEAENIDKLGTHLKFRDGHLKRV